jgi:hypothetical protein
MNGPRARCPARQREGRGKEREREARVPSCATCSPNLPSIAAVPAVSSPSTSPLSTSRSSSPLPSPPLPSESDFPVSASAGPLSPSSSTNPSSAFMALSGPVACKSAAGGIFALTFLNRSAASSASLVASAAAATASRSWDRFESLSFPSSAELS